MKNYLIIDMLGEECDFYFTLKNKFIDSLVEALANELHSPDVISGIKEKPINAGQNWKFFQRK